MAIIEIKEVCKNFGEKVALDHVSFEIPEGKIFGLLGPNGELSDIQQAFIDETAIQCGFCTPGLVLTGVELYNSGRTYTREELRECISGHLCRCTGYENILNALEKVVGKDRDNQ